MIKENDIIVIFGRRGCGKTTLQEKIAQVFPRLITIDRLREHNDGDLVTSNFDDFSNFLLAAVDGRGFRVVYQFDVETATETQQEEFSQVMRLAYKFGSLTGHPIAVSIEEVHFYAGPTSINKWLFESVLTGRHANMAILCSSQRPASVAKAIVSQASHVFVGQLFEPRDLEYLKDCIGYDAAQAVIGLPPFKFVHFEQGQGFKII